MAMNLHSPHIDDSMLREALVLPEGKEGLRYYLSKGDKIEYLTPETTDERRTELLELARKKQMEHHAYLTKRRKEGSPKRQVLIEQRMSGSAWRYVAQERAAKPFKDEVTGRKAHIAFIVENVTTGERLRVTKSTLVDAYERLGIIIGWPPPKTRVASPEAALAGLNTPAELRSNLSHLRQR